MKKIEFNNTCATKCVDEALNYLNEIKREYEESGFVFHTNISSCGWALEHAIINRVGISMSEACMRYIDKVDYQTKLFNGI